MFQNGQFCFANYSLCVQKFLIAKLHPASYTNHFVSLYITHLEYLRSKKASNNIGNCMLKSFMKGIDLLQSTNSCSKPVNGKCVCPLGVNSSYMSQCIFSLLFGLEYLIVIYVNLFSFCYKHFLSFFYRKL